MFLQQSHRKDVTVLRDLSYGAHPDQIYDLHVPQWAPSPPVVISVHGGGWRSGDKADVWGLAALLDRGLAVASVNYRLAPEHRWPAQKEDLIAAVAAVSGMGAETGIDGGRPALLGCGAGGHLAAVGALCSTPTPRAVAVLFAPVEFDAMDTDMGRSGVTPEGGRADAAGSAPCDLIGEFIADNPAAAAQASPLTVLAQYPSGRALPDMLLLHGAKDPVVARGQSARLAYALAQHPGTGRLEFGVLPGSGHGGAGFDRPEVVERVVEFLAAGPETGR